jgi:hypothetical protein
MSKMTDLRLPTPEQIDELVAFLPKLYAEGFVPAKEWSGAKFVNGVLTAVSPDYDEVVRDFFRVVANDWWFDREYIPADAWDMIQNEDTIKTSSLPQIRIMLTYCMRGERFCDGHWATMIEEGYIRRVLERLIAIRAQMTS